MDKLSTADDPDAETDPGPLAEMVPLAHGSVDPNADQPAEANGASEDVPSEADTTA